MPIPRLRLLPYTIKSRLHLLLALVAVELVIVTALVAAAVVGSGGDSDDFVARDTLLAEPDLPAGWMPIEASVFPYMTNSPLLTLLLEEETVAGAFSAYRDPQDSSAVATYVVFRPAEPPASLARVDSDSLEKVTPLVLELERLARRRLNGALPELFFAATDVPTPGGLRARSLVPRMGEQVQSDSILFTAGPVLALVVVEHPGGAEPFRPVEELALLVHGRILEQLD